ncbi:MAG: hypothetical protein PHE27_07315, partial [Alphaproteobacteria bacterium]|nr:hypothetical protein [Alphaproteobacteria bacterium]
VFEGKDAARDACSFGLALAASSALLLLTARAPGHLFDVDVLAYSVVYVILTASMALCFSGVAIVRNKTLLVRILTGALLALAAGGAFLYAFPSMMGGPYGGMHPDIAKLIFSVAPEAWPIFGPRMVGGLRFFLSAWAIVAAGANLFMLARARGRSERWLWGMNFFVLLACFALAAFYQIRFKIFVDMFSILPIVGTLKFAWDRRTGALSTLGVWGLFVFAMLVLIMPGAFKNNPKPRAQAQGAAQSETEVPKNGCSNTALAKVLNDPHGLGDRPRLILNTINESADILLRTPHYVLAGPYHTNVSGNLDSLHFFLAADPEEAKAIVDRRHVDLIALCDRPAQIRAYRPAPGEPAPAKETFLDRLTSNRIPDWLRPIRSDTFGQYLLFEVVRPEKQAF